MSPQARNQGIRHGFTMVELLVVIGIILILASIAVPTFRMVKERQNEKRAEAEIQIIETAIQNFQSDLGDSPSLDILEDKLGSAVPDTAKARNWGNEMLVACLYSKIPEIEGKPPYLPVLLTGDGGEKLADSDQDGWKELCDPWNRCYVYFHNTDYHSGTEDSYGAVAIELFKATPKTKTEGEYYRLTSFQLWSCGRNGENNTSGGSGVTSKDDDIRNWTD